MNIDLHLAVRLFNLILLIMIAPSQASEDAKRLLKDLLRGYNKIVRPVRNTEDKVELFLGIKLSQIADIDERNQIMTTNVWVRHEWFDYKLKWDPIEYGNITKINMPSSSIWIADVVLYNNADGDYQITTKTKVTVHYDGKVVWEPPMIYKSYCAIDIEYYPFDIQQCYMKFGSWTFDGNLIDLQHLNINSSVPEKNITKIQRDGSSSKLYTVEFGIDMSDYYQSVEWDILTVPAQKNIKYYDCCLEPFYDIYFNITIRRKTLFYTVNLIIPCVNISFLSVLVFYLPSDSGEKLTLGISILVALLVFYLLLIELIPPTSLVIPLLGKYLLFTLILVNLSILLTIFILNLHHRKPNTHKMPYWMKYVFIQILPRFLMIQRPENNIHRKMDNSYKKMFNQSTSSNSWLRFFRKPPGAALTTNQSMFSRKVFNFDPNKYSSSDMIGIKQTYPASINSAIDGIRYMNYQVEKEKSRRFEIDDWKYASMVIDRLFLWIFTSACFIGTFAIFLQAPSIYDNRKPLVKN